MITAEQKDIILYQCGNRVDSDRERLKVNLDLDDFYSGRYNEHEIKTIVVNPAEVLDDIKSRLSKIELFVLEKLSKVRP